MTNASLSESVISIAAVKNEQKRCSLAAEVYIIIIIKREYMHQMNPYNIILLYYSTTWVILLISSSLLCIIENLNYICVYYYTYVPSITSYKDVFHWLHHHMVLPVVICSQYKINKYADRHKSSDASITSISFFG